MRQTFGLVCGNSLCDFELAPYKFVWKPPPPPRDSEEEESSRESENEGEDAESDEDSNGSFATGLGEAKDDKQLLPKGVSDTEWNGPFLSGCNRSYILLSRGASNLYHT